MNDAQTARHGSSHGPHYRQRNGMITTTDQRNRSSRYNLTYPGLTALKGGLGIARHDGHITSVDSAEMLKHIKVRGIFNKQSIRVVDGVVDAVASYGLGGLVGTSAVVDAVRTSRGSKIGQECVGRIDLDPFVAHAQERNVSGFQISSVTGMRQFHEGRHVSTEDISHSSIHTYGSDLGGTVVGIFPDLFVHDRLHHIKGLAARMLNCVSLTLGQDCSPLSSSRL